MEKEQSILSTEAKDPNPFFGVASLSSGILAIVILLISFSYAYYMLSIGNTDRIVFIIADILVFANGLSIFAGLVFGVIGLFQKNRKKILAMIGLILSSIAGFIYCLSITWLAG